MMTVEIDPAIQAEPALYSSIRRAHEEFNTYFIGRGPTFDSVSAFWKFIPDQKEKSLVRLEMKDRAEHAAREFPIDQLWDSRQATTRMTLVLRDLLQNQSRRLSKELQDMGPVAEGD